MTDAPTLAPVSAAAKVRGGPVIANVVAAIALGSVVFQLSGQLGLSPIVAETQPVRISDVAALGALLLAGFIGSARPLRNFGWLLSAAGLALSALLFLSDDVLPSAAFYPALAVVVALQLGGTVRAFATADARSRWGIVAGLAVGFFAGFYALSEGVRGLRSLGIGPREVNEVTMLVLAALTALAGLAVLRAGVPTEVLPDEAGVPTEAAPDEAGVPGPDESTVDGRRWEAVAGIGAAAVVGGVLTALLRGWLERQAAARVGEVSEAQAAATHLTYELARTLTGVLIGVILLVVAYRRGGPSLARWVVAAFAVAVVGAPVPAILANDTNAGRMVAMAVVGVGLGVFAARGFDRTVPWDAVGLVIVVIGALIGGTGALLVAFGIGLTLAAGFGRVVTEGAGRVAWSLLLGFAALQLVTPIAAHEYAFVAYGPLRDADGLPLGPGLREVSVMLGAAVMLAGLWLLERGVMGRRQRE